MWERLSMKLKHLNNIFLNFAWIIWIYFCGPQGSWSVHVCCLHLKMEFCSCARGRQWCGIIHYHWWTASIKPRLLFSRAGYASWGLSLSSVLYLMSFLCCRTFFSKWFVWLFLSNFALFLMSQLYLKDQHVNNLNNKWILNAYTFDHNTFKLVTIDFSAV